MAKIKQERKSKYKFATLDVGGKFLCKRVDYNSMLTSLRQYNKRNETDIEVSAEDTLKESLLSITRIK